MKHGGSPCGLGVALTPDVACLAVMRLQAGAWSRVLFKCVGLLDVSIVGALSRLNDTYRDIGNVRVSCIAMTIPYPEPWSTETLAGRKAVASLGLIAGWGFSRELPVLLLDGGDLRRAVPGKGADLVDRVEAILDGDRGIGIEMASACAAAIAGCRERLKGHSL